MLTAELAQDGRPADTVHVLTLWLEDAYGATAQVPLTVTFQLVPGS